MGRHLESRKQGHVKEVTWAETQFKEKEITQWLQQGIQLQTSGQTCAL